MYEKLQGFIHIVMWGLHQFSYIYIRINILVGGIFYDIIETNLKIPYHGTHQSIIDS
jgi:hypothetical protein